MLVMKMQHGVFGNPGCLWILQVTGPNAAIQILLQLLALFTVVFDLQQMFPFSTP